MWVCGFGSMWESDRDPLSSPISSTRLFFPSERERRRERLMDRGAMTIAIRITMTIMVFQRLACVF